MEVKRDVNADALLEERQFQRLDCLRCLQSSAQIEVLDSVLLNSLWKDGKINELCLQAVPVEVPISFGCIKHGK